MSINAAQPVKRRFEILPPRTPELFAQVRGTRGARTSILRIDSQANATTEVATGDWVPAGATIIEARIGVDVIGAAVQMILALIQQGSTVEQFTPPLWGNGSTIDQGIPMLTTDQTIPIMRTITEPGILAMRVRHDAGGFRTTFAIVSIADPQPVLQTPLP